MDIGEIIKDSLKYPFSDWKKILFLGLIMIISSVDVIGLRYYELRNISIEIILITIGFILFLVVSGYSFRIVKSSLNGEMILPKFNAWLIIFKDAIKVLIVGAVYLIPITILTLIFSKLIFNYIFIGILEGTPTSIFVKLLAVILVSFFGGHFSSLLAITGVSLFIASIYAIIIIPFYYAAIVNMAKYDGKLSAAFKLGEICNKIRDMGFKKLVIFYILLIIPLFVIHRIEQKMILGYYILVLLIISPYLRIFIYRLTALMYKSEEN